MAFSGSLQLSLELGICKSHRCNEQFQNVSGRRKLLLLGGNLSFLELRRDSSGSYHLKKIRRRPYPVPYRYQKFSCHSFLKPDHSLNISCIKNSALALTRSCQSLQGSPVLLKVVSAVGIVVFAVWGLGPLVRQSRNIFPHKSDDSWKKSSTHYVLTSYLQPLLLWTGAILICRTLDPVVLPTEASQIVKQRLLNFVRSLSTVLAFAYCLSSVIQQTQKFFTEMNDPTDSRNMGFQFAGKAVYTAVWVAAVSLFMELLGFSTQRWLTAGGLGTVLLTLAGREIFTNFLSSAMIHATRPFVLNEWIQTKIEGYEVSGTVEHVGWWSPTIVRGEDREAVHIPNHKFTVNIVRNLSQKTHWRIKTHLAISHLDVNKINNIVADMRKVLAKNPQVEQQKLHRRVFLDNINPENQALLILVSCFVKTSHFEEYLCVKEAILLDLLRVIRHHRARLATPIRTVQKIYSDADLENIPYADSVFNNGAASSRPLLLIEPPYKVNGEDRTKSQARSARPSDEDKSTVRSAPDDKATSKSETVLVSDSKIREATSFDSQAKETPASDSKADSEVRRVPKTDTKEDRKTASKAASDSRISNKAAEKSSPASVSKTDSKVVPVSSLNSLASSNTNQSASDNQNPKKVGKRSTPSSAVDNAQESGGKPENFSSTLPRKQEDAKPTATQPLVTKPPLEENIVLGVALEGSKRTLPIEEDMTPPSLPEENKELAGCRSGNSPQATEKDKKETQHSLGSKASDQPDQKD